MEMTVDISNNFSCLSTLKSDSSMFFCQPKREAIDQDDLDSFQRHEQIKINTNPKRIKTTVSFPFGKCRVCHDNATGVHYGVITCEGCKGFFKRSITQGIPYRCFFGDKCIISLETRNRCKACRFKQCIEQGMAMESVKMGRIPKKVKEKALKIYQKQRQQNEDFYDNDDDNNSELDNFSLPSIKRESTSSSSSSCSSSMNTQQSIDSKQRMSDSVESPICTADFIELTISSSNLQVADLNHSLSSLRLPPVLYETYPFTSDVFGKYTTNSKTSDNGENLKGNDSMTVSKLISNINENTLIDYMFGCELRYSKNVLQIMKYLATKLRQPFLIYELDFEVTSFFRYIRWKMLNFYLNHTRRLRMLVERMFGLIDLGIKDFPGANATAEQMWEDVQAGISTQVTDLLNFAKDTPGLNELNVHDLTRILNNRMFEFWTLIHYPLFYQNESYFLTINGLHYNRYFMNKFIGKTTTDAIHEFSERLQNLNLTQVEHSLIIPVVLCLPDEQLNDSESVHTVKYCYMYALYIQLCTTRTEEEAKSVFNNILQIIDSIAVLNELCHKNIGELILDKKNIF